jgi:hypothetical protein
MPMRVWVYSRGRPFLLYPGGFNSFLRMGEASLEMDRLAVYFPGSKVGHNMSISILPFGLFDCVNS